MTYVVASNSNLYIMGTAGPGVDQSPPAVPAAASPLRGSLGNLLGIPNISTEEKLILAHHRIRNYRDNLNEVDSPVIIIPLKFVGDIDLAKVLQQWQDYLNRRENSDYDSAILLDNLFEHTIKTFLERLRTKNKSEDAPSVAVSELG